MRILDKAGVTYQPHFYGDTGAVSGMEVAAVLEQDPNRVFKTLVTVGKSRTYYVFVLPVNRELSLKKAAAAVGEKSVEMIKTKDLLPVTGYIHGGCSPIGMKKRFATTFHTTAGDFSNILFSAGKIGYQVELCLDDLRQVIDFKLADIVE